MRLKIAVALCAFAAFPDPALAEIWYRSCAIPRATPAERTAIGKAAADAAFTGTGKSGVFPADLPELKTFIPKLANCKREISWNEPNLKAAISYSIAQFGIEYATKQLAATTPIKLEQIIQFYNAMPAPEQGYLRQNGGFEPERGQQFLSNMKAVIGREATKSELILAASTLILLAGANADQDVSGRASMADIVEVQKRLSSGYPNMRVTKEMRAAAPGLFRCMIEKHKPEDRLRYGEAQAHEYAGEPGLISSLGISFMAGFKMPASLCAAKKGWGAQQVYAEQYTLDSFAAEWARVTLQKGANTGPDIVSRIIAQSQPTDLAVLADSLVLSPGLERVIDAEIAKTSKYAGINGRKMATIWLAATARMDVDLGRFVDADGVLK